MQKWGTGARARTECSFRCNFFTSPLAVAVVALLSRNVVIAAVGRIVVVSERRAVEPSGCVSLAPPAASVPFQFGIIIGLASKVFED